MFDALTVISIWVISIFSAGVTMRRSKGADWYAPVGNKQRMFMTLLNLSLWLMILAFFGQYLIKQWSITWISSVASLIVICFLAERTRSINPKRKYNKDTNIDDAEVNDAQDSASDDHVELADQLRKAITVFNSVFFILNVAYIGLILFSKLPKEESPTIDDLRELQIAFEADYSLLIAYSFLFWTCLAGIIFTALGWRGTEDERMLRRKKPKGALFYARRIVDRNRK